MFSYFLRFLLVASIATLFSPISLFAAGYIGEDLGSDIYKRIDDSYGSVTDVLAKKRITGSNSRLNKAIEAQCKTKAGARFLKSGQDFTREELFAIDSGILTPLMNRIDTAGQGGNSG